MKKYIAAFAFFLTATISMNAQNQEATYQTLAKKDMAELSQIVNLQESQKEDFFRLFEMKHEVTSNKNMSQERKTVMIQVIEAKIRGTLSAEQMAILESKPEVLNRLIGKTETK